MERVVVFGSTGKTGIAAVEAAVKKGLNVRAFVRDPSRLPDHLRNSVEVVKGDILNYTDVHNAIKDTTAVVSALGTGTDLGPTTVMSDGMKNIVKAMKDLNVDIISLCLSAFLFYELDKVPPIFTHVNADHMREYEVVKESGLKYIAVSPPHIADMDSTEYITKFNENPGRAISKHALGKFLIDSLTEPDRYGKMWGICNKPQ
ncbi:flavin reductase (nadph) [Holotrichia oblita]|uniref:Flavin reductase (Nadph) n=2 Tax=Holotrichia oblita TaxID=644536 RepID=A0ACB9TNN4_HOLOL|nr:flavin reductase (nadph) [Holotrichia oblita]KAI4468422.1 flavin reductase (nadph) [Holotrichia oblita]